ncbi:MAG: metal-dependent transcriptional regulator [Clostridia bacterium]|nr:metal-dependent transcriptional regulator [Clostridia bacterium]
MCQAENNGQSGEFRTLTGYRDAEKKRITSAMEDYLEMIFRMAADGAPVRAGDLARRLHVTPSSATKMITNLAECGCVDAARYGYVTLTEYGRCVGEYLMTRHDTVHRFFCLLNGTESELEQTEKVEHFILPRTLIAMEQFLAEHAKVSEERN